MELKCILVLTLVPLVTASPHGYGVKGGAGAAAKAEAVAGAGAFAGIPLAIPSGAGYSGSFAKSSSSSFAASSASSSASSFSFSGSGTVGANGLNDVGGNGGGTEGCNGHCKNGNNVIPDTSGVGKNNQAYSGAKAAAGVGAVAVSGAPYDKSYQAPCSSGDCSEQKTTDCGGSNCGDTTHNNVKCTSGKCEPTPEATDTKVKCTSGECSPYSPEPENASSYNTDDIQVKFANSGPKSLQNSNELPKKYYKKPSDYEPSQLSSSTPNKPTEYLTTPKEDTSCRSPGCAPASSLPGGAYDKQKPSSYNVPILGPNYAPSTQNIVPCSSGNCNSDQPGSPHMNIPSGPSESGSICTLGSCQKYPNNQINPESPGVPSGYKPLSPSGVPAVSTSSGAKNPSYVQPITPPNSAFVNTGAAASANAVGNYGSAKPTTVLNDKKHPPYTGGFGGPAGILKPNDFSAPNQMHVSSYKPIQSTAPIATTPCTSGNCATRPTKPEASCNNGKCGGPQFPVSPTGNPAIQLPSQPSACSSGSCGSSPGSTSIPHIPSFSPPSSSVNFGGPSGILKPNDYNKPGPRPTTTQESYNPPGVPSVQHDQTTEPNTVQYKLAGTPICSSGYCGDEAPSSGAYSPSGPSNPNTQTPSVGFGGPAGIQKPNEVHRPLIPSFKPTSEAELNYNPSGPFSPQHDQANNPNNPQYKPTGPNDSKLCSSGNCGYQPPQPQFGSAATVQTYPTLCGSSKCESQPPPNTQIPSVSFGGPTGILKPNDSSKPLTSGYKPTPATVLNYNPPRPSSPQEQAAPQPQEQINKANTPQYKPVSPSDSTPCSLGNCEHQPPQQQVCGSGKCESQPPPNAQIPSVGFGGPMGILKPNDFNKPLAPSYKPTPSAAFSYNPHISSSSQHDQTNKPNTHNQYKPTGPSDSKPCSLGSCGYQPPQPQFISSVTAQTNPALCGSGKCEPQPSQTSKGPAGGYNPTYCSSGNCGTNPLPPVPSKPTTPSSPGLKHPDISGSYHSTFHSSPSSSNYGPSHSHLPSHTHSSSGTAATSSFDSLCSSGKCREEQLSPQYNTGDSRPASSANIYNPQICPTGNCGSLTQVPNIPSTSTGAFSSAICSSGNCGVNSVPLQSRPHYNQPGSTNIAVGAVASAGAVAYTGGFGGPPGLLKPYDGGKLNSLPVGFGLKGPLGAAPYGSTIQSSYEKSLTGTGSSQSGAGAHASVVAGAAAGSYGGHSSLGGHNGQGSAKGGCTTGCDSLVGSNFGHNGGLDGFGALSAAGASAKSVAGAFGGGGAGAYGQAGSFASSSATAHASAGASTKTGYGKR